MDKIPNFITKKEVLFDFLLDKNYKNLDDFKFFKLDYDIEFKIDGEYIGGWYDVIWSETDKFIGNGFYNYVLFIPTNDEYKRYQRKQKLKRLKEC